MARTKKSLELHPPLEDDLTSRYSDEYREKCFITWYSHGCPNSRSLLSLIEPDETGKTPCYALLTKWRKVYGWELRADQMNREVQRRVQEASIAEKVRMLERHTQVAFSMVETGMNYINEFGPQNSNAAVRLIIEGIRIERDSRGLSEALKKISELSDDSLDETIAKLLGRMSDLDIDALSDDLRSDDSSVEDMVDGELIEQEDYTE